VNCGTVQPPSFALDCPSVMPSDCLSRLIRICPPPPSVPVANCQTVPIQNCWAPTTAPGCDNPVSVLRCPSRVCTTVINPTIVNTTVVGTNPIRDANAGFPPYGAASRGGLTEDQGDARPPADKGYYDYDESWWE
jgi:hypothetical protein